MAQIPNGNFENWTNDGSGNLNPDGWTTSNSSPDTSVIRFTPAYSGNYSMLVRTMDIGGGFIFPGMAYVEFPYTSRPTQFKVCLKTTVASGDRVIVEMALTKNGNAVAAMDSCTFKFDSSMTQYHCLTLPIIYVGSQNPDTAIVMVLAGNFTGAKLGTKVIVDEMSFGFGGTGMEIPVSHKPANAYPNPASQTFNIPIYLNSATQVKVSLYDLSGKEVLAMDKGIVTAGQQLMQVGLDQLSNGVYSYVVQGLDHPVTGKFTVSR